MKTMREVCELVGITRRTLQLYNDVELLKPTAKTEGGYWLYDDAAIQKLMTIRLFVEAGYTRRETKRILESSETDVKAELDTMLSSLIEKRDRLNRMISGIQVLKSVQERQQEEGQSDYDMQAVYQIPGSLVENMWSLFDKAYESDPDDESQRVLLPAFITMAVSSLQTNRNPSSKLMQNSVREIYDHTEQNFRVIIERMKSEQPELKDIDLKWSDMFLSYLEEMFNQKGFRRLFRFLPKNTREYMMDAARIFLDTGLHAA